MTESSRSSTNGNAEALLQDNPEELRRKQLLMAQEWETRTGQRLPGAAKIILEHRRSPLTQEDYLLADGGGMELDDLLSDDEALAEMPDFFLDLPRGTSPGLY